MTPGFEGHLAQPLIQGLRTCLAGRCGSRDKVRNDQPPFLLHTKTTFLYARLHLLYTVSTKFFAIGAGIV